MAKKLAARKTSNTIETIGRKDIEYVLSPKKEAFSLEVHGTHPAKLSARNLIQTAESDLRAKARNAAINAENKKPQRERNVIADEPIRPYAFGPMVEGVDTVAELLARALELRPHILRLDKSEAEQIEIWRQLPLSTLRVYRDIEALVAGPYLELFGRQSRPGWSVMGDQSTLFDIDSGPLFAQDLENAAACG